MKGTMPPGSHAVFVLVADFAEAGCSQLVAKLGGAVTLRKTPAEGKASSRTLVEYTWNHTTAHAKKVDKGLTYIQSGYAAGQHLAQAQALRRQLGDKVLVLLELIRTKEGEMTCSWCATAPTNGWTPSCRRTATRACWSPTRMSGTWKTASSASQVNPDIVSTTLRLDPAGLLNPGKRKGRAQCEQTMADAATGRLQPPVLATLPRF